ncbi:MAG: hypothetical protein J7L66_00455 [Anaerolineaceae bacterium]|nr:hypothetical protein [Anaerolineaceae bacterium]
MKSNMDLSEIRDVLELIWADDIDQIQIINGNQLYDRHILMHSLNSFALYTLDVQPSRLDIIVKVIQATYKCSVDVGCLYKVQSSWKMDWVNTENIFQFLSGKERVYL